MKVDERGVLLNPQPAALANPARGRFHYAYLIILLGTLTLLGVQGFQRFAYAMILPSMRETMGLSYAQTGMLATANYAGFTLAAALIGFLVLRFGQRAVIGAGVTVAGLAMFLTGAAQSYELALALQVVAGAGAGVSSSTALSLAGPWFVAHRRGMAAGAMASGGPLGSLITGPLLPMLIAAFGTAGWRYGWLALGSAVVVVGLLDLTLLRNHPAEKGLAAHGAKSATVLPKRERVDLKQIYRMPIVWHLALLALASTLGAISFNTFFTAYLVNERAVTIEVAGQLWALAGIVGLVGGFVWGGISDRVGRKLALLGSASLQGLGFALFALGGGVFVFALCAFLYGITARANFVVLAAYCGDLLGDRHAAAAFGLVALFAGMGLTIGPTLSGLVADLTGSFTIAFWGSAAVLALGALGSAALPAKPTPHRATALT